MDECNLTLVNIFFNQMKEIDGMSVVYNQSGAVIIPPKSKYYYLPNIIVRKLDVLQKSLENYLFAVQSSKIKSMMMDEKHDIKYFLGNLTKNLTNYDSNNFEEYVDMCTAFINDNTFSEYDEKTELGNLDEDNKIIVKRSQEYYGSETPFVFKTIIKNKHIEYELPLIRYGIYSDNNGNKVVRIYMIQRKKNYIESPAIMSINKKLSVINSGIKEERNVQPSMIIVLSIFLGLLQKEEISQIIVPDFMTRRFGHFQNVNSEEERENIQYRATNIFINLFLRIKQHFDGINIKSFPNDVDSFLHISLDKEIICNNDLLKKCYLLGCNEKSIDTHTVNK